MAAGKEIRGKIKSVENTKKITKAMEMVAASKMRKAQDRMRSARPYAEKVRQIAADLGRANPEYVHPYLATNNAKTLGLIVVTTDKGLCGGLNTNVLRAVTNRIRDAKAAGHDVKRWRLATRVWVFSIARACPLWRRPSSWVTPRTWTSSLARSRSCSMPTSMAR